MGIINQNMKPDAEDEQEPPEQPGEAPDAEDQAEGPEENAQGGDQPNVTPQEQEQYDTVVVAALTFLYAPGSTKIVVQKLKDEATGTGTGTASLAHGIGHTCAMILLSVKRALAQQQVTVDPDIIFNAGKEVIAEIIKIAETAGLAQPGDEQLLKTSAFEAVKAFGDSELQSGEITPQVRQQAKQEMEQMRGSAPAPGIIGNNMAPQGAAEEK